MKRNALAIAAFGVGIAVALTACSSSGTPAGRGDGASDAITIVSMAGITTDAVMQVAIDKGTFKEAGLDAKFVEVENPPAALAAMQGGTANFAYSPLSTALTALSKGIDIKIVAAADGFPDTQGDAQKVDDTGVFVNPKDGVTSAAQLAGKNVAVPSRNGMMEITIAGAVKAAGGDPSTIKWLALDQQSQISSLKQGRIQAAGLATPFTDKAEAEGMKLLVRPKSVFFEHGAAGVWITTGAFAKAHADVVTKFQKATAAANEYGNAHNDVIAEQVIKAQKLTVAAADVVVGYFPPTVLAADVERANTKIADLGYLEKPVDLKGVVIESK